MYRITTKQVVSQALPFSVLRSSTRPDIYAYRYISPFLGRLSLPITNDNLIPSQSIRLMSNKSRFSPSQIYQSLIKKSMSMPSGEWDFHQYESSSEISQYQFTARKLKESLVPSQGSDTLDYAKLKSLLVQLLTELPTPPRFLIDKTTLPVYQHRKVILNSFSILFRSDELDNNPDNSKKFHLPTNMSLEDIQLLYKLMIEKTSVAFSGMGRNTIVPNLFSLLQAANTQKLISNEDLLSFSLLYFKHLDALNHRKEALSLLKWLSSVYKPQTNKAVFTKFLTAISLPSLETECIPALFFPGNDSADSKFIPSAESFHMALISLSSNPSKFLSFIEKALKQFGREIFDIDCIIAILKPLNNHLHQKSEIKEFFNNFFQPYMKGNDFDFLSFEKIFNFTSEEQKLQFYKLFTLTLVKLGEGGNISLSSQQDKFLEYICSPANFPNSDVTDFRFYKKLKEVKNVSNAQDIIDIFESAKSNGVELTDDFIQNSLDIISCENFNNIVKYFNEIHDYFLENSKYQSDIKTFNNLIICALNNNSDVDSAIFFFEESLNHGISWDQRSQTHDTSDQSMTEYMETLDNLIVCMCEKIPDDVKRVFSIYQKIRMFTKAVGYNAQVALAKLFLSYNFVGDVERFLEDELGPDERNVYWKTQRELYEVLFNYACESQNYRDAWLIYGLCEKYFASPHFAYKIIMKHFCDLGRPDASLLIFKNMRNRFKDTGVNPPTEDIYSLLFHEFGKVGYDVGVNDLFICLKMDITVEPSIALVNEAMNAYTELDDVSKAVQLWREICSFPGGPNHDSYTTVLKLCTKVSIQDVEKMWNQLKEDAPKLGGISDENYRQYIIANCYHGFYARALDIAKNMAVIEAPKSKSNELVVKTNATTPSRETIISLYNWTMTEARKKDVEEWAKETYPHIWNSIKPEELKHYVLDEANPNNDSEANLRFEAIGQMTQDNKKATQQLLHDSDYETLPLPGSDR